jgi:hypothetical protein
MDIDPETAHDRSESRYLRSSLGVAILGFKVSDLVVEIGVFLIPVGGAERGSHVPMSP